MVYQAVDKKVKKPIIKSKIVGSLGLQIPKQIIYYVVARCLVVYKAPSLFSAKLISSDDIEINCWKIVDWEILHSITERRLRKSHILWVKTLQSTAMSQEKTIPLSKAHIEHQAT